MAKQVSCYHKVLSRAKAGSYVYRRLYWLCFTRNQIIFSLPKQKLFFVQRSQLGIRVLYSAPRVGQATALPQGIEESPGSIG